LQPTVNIQAVLKNGLRYNFAIDDPNEKKLYRKRNGSKNTTNLSEHIIFIPSTHLWAMDNFYFSNSNLYFFLLILLDFIVLMA
jgi:hypothetical protein